MAMYKLGTAEKQLVRNARHMQPLVLSQAAGCMSAARRTHDGISCPCPQIIQLRTTFRSNCEAIEGRWRLLPASAWANVVFQCQVAVIILIRPTILQNSCKGFHFLRSDL